jgi:hypothetical protein
MPDYIPSREGDKMNWLLNNSSYVNTNATSLGVPTGRASVYLSAVSAADAAITAATVAADQAKAATTNKQEKIAAAVEIGREIAGIVQANPAVTNPQRDAGGWPIHQTSRTPQPGPSVIPAVVLKPSTPWAQEIGIIVPSDPTSRARPANVEAWQVFLCVSDAAPVGTNNCRLVGQTTKPSFTVPFESADASKTAWIIVRAVGNKGEFGPLSAPVPVQIAASLAA